MNDFTFLEEEQIFGNQALSIFNKYGTKCAISDFSILLGGYVNDSYYTDEGNELKDRTGWWWTRTPYSDNARAVLFNGDCYWSDVDSRDGGARPALPYSLIESISSNKVRGRSNVLEVDYGEYPQSVLRENESLVLERLYNSNSLKVTGKRYTTDSVKYNDYDKTFQKREHIEYEYNGKKYIRFVADANADGETLSDGRTVQLGSVYWVCVEPITWLIDEEKNIALCKKIIFSGVQFKNQCDYTGNFHTTDIKQFMNNCFAKEIGASSISLENTIEETQQENKKKNPYRFCFDSVSEEDIIRGAIESNVSVFLHGRSSEGKSARVKQLDPDCEIIYLRNATLDSLNGKSVYNAVTEEMMDIPPTWFKKIEKKCEEEPDKIHIVFFDEITNALPSIQGSAFNIVLDGEVNGIWKLPSNARIVAAGNDLNDSLAANQMAEPLFNRFAHVYINTTVDSWLKWASMPKTEYERLPYEKKEEPQAIHPSIYAYVAYKSYGGQEVLRTPYNGEKPNADPRKWEMASKVLYATKKPEMLRALVGEELTRDFIAFVRQKVITVEDVLHGNYSDRDLEMNTAEKFATAVGLSSVDNENMAVIRSFVMKLGPEIGATFDSLWTHGDEARLEQIAELKMAELAEGGMKR